MHFGNLIVCLIKLFCRYIIAVFAKTVGVPIVSACTASPDTGWELLSNCVHRLVDTNLLGGTNCAASNTCLTADNPSCCSTSDVITEALECTTGYFCKFIQYPNSQTLCNTDACNCDSRNPCVALSGDLPVCSPVSSWQYRNSTSLDVLPTFQDWQFYSNTVWYDFLVLPHLNQIDFNGFFSF